MPTELHSVNVWQNCPFLDAPSCGQGNYYFNDFTEQVTGSSAAEYLLTQASAGTLTRNSAASGTILLDAGSTTTRQGAQLQWYGDQWCAPQKTLWFETRVKVTAANGQFFIGLASTDTTIIATDAMSAAEYVGFKSINGSTVWTPCTYHSAETTGDTSTLTTATWYKLGFRAETNADGKVVLKYYVDGDLTATINTGTYSTSTYVPSAPMQISYVCQSHGTYQPTMEIDWVAVAQLR
jgi:hypothetical protein